MGLGVAVGGMGVSVGVAVGGAVLEGVGVKVETITEVGVGKGVAVGLPRVRAAVETAAVGGVFAWLRERVSHRPAPPAIAKPAQASRLKLPSIMKMVRLFIALGVAQGEGLSFPKTIIV
jgi:hypothetical protein